MSKIAKQSAALALIQDKDVGAGIPLNKLQLVAVQQFQRIARDTKEAPLRAILLGLTLHRVKASMPRGTFEAWKNSNVTASNVWTESTTRKNCSFYMRLAIAAVENTGATKPDLLALPGDQTELAIEGEGQARKFMAKLQDYIGERTIDEILHDEGIKGGSGKKGKRGGGGGTEPEKEMTMQERFNETEAALNLALAGACNKSYWLEWKKQQHQDLLDIFAAAHARVSENFVKTHGRKK